QQDLGDSSLFDYIKEGRERGLFTPEVKEILAQTIRQLVDFQYQGADELDFSVCYPQTMFDSRTVLWDLNYFKYAFLKPLGVHFLEDRLEDDFERMAKVLTHEPTDTFLYRDFQSRNVMLFKGNPYFIDYQGGRKGPVYYDLASFLWQAKANYPDHLRNELIDVYLEKLSEYRPVDADQFRVRLDQFVLFRTLQVLGAYGFRGYFEQKSHFLESIPFALKNLGRLLIKGFPEYPYLTQVLREVIAQFDDQEAASRPNDFWFSFDSFTPNRERIPLDSPMINIYRGKRRI
ncbi:phosphotransferase, partial [Bacteroidales bacterium OttesenSCG-928-L03]|nr:phosphotransferase [Bacteroidales bacterium OttesenSCG-928-L03]